MSRTKRTMIYSRKAYTGTSHSEKVFAKNVLQTAEIANNQEHHIELLKEIYPTYHIEPLYTYEHSIIQLERIQSCKWDSSADAMCAFKKESELEKAIEKINKDLLNYE